MWIAFDDGANAVYGTRARVADTGDWNAANGEMSGRNVSDRTAVSGWIVQTDDVRHDRGLAELAELAFRRIPAASKWSPSYASVDHLLTFATG